ncbi:hypothetical protein D6833_03645 [Candidatus Parcubacteria bacterium]|nr:MAG: hypothetical protein D6833_03645 [Candidatus Parcubacteria bacterium]
MPYLAYMLRLWSSEQDGKTICRASLEDVHDSNRLVFADLESLIAFLRAKATELDPSEKQA